MYIHTYIHFCFINKTQLHIPTDCFTPWNYYQGDIIQIELDLPDNPSKERYVYTYS